MGREKAKMEGTPAPGPALQMRLFVAPDQAGPHGQTCDWTTEEVAGRFRRSIDGFDARAALKTPIIRDTLRTLSLIPCAKLRVLDVGCGAGTLSAALQVAGLPFDQWHYTGLEANEALVHHSRAAFPQASFQIGRGESIPCAGGSFDLAMCSGVIQYVTDWQRVLAELMRVSNRWVAVLRTPLVKHTPSTICIQEVRSAAGLERHVMTVFNRDEFERSLQEAGLTPLDRDYTEEIHRVEGLDERVVHLNYLLHPTQ